jgi:hypothetical protein
LALFIAGCVTNDPLGRKATSEACIVDRAALLAQPQDAFDQDMKGGWRQVAQREGCELAAADLLREYREANPAARQSSLYWHEGQLRAGQGQTKKAVSLFLHSYHDGTDDAWNLYVDATIAFLQDDLETLMAARRKLADMPPPPGYAAGVEVFRETYPDLEPPKWPFNLDVIEALITCFGRPYNEAYGAYECRYPTG